MTNSPVADALKTVLADSYALYIKTQNFHWNVTGPQFKGLHELFQLQYTDLALAIDDIAERIRALGHKAPGTLKQYSALTSIQDGKENASASDMVKHLRDDQHTLVASLKRALKHAEEAEDDVTQDLLVGRMTVHQKNAWMLESSL